MHTQILFQEDMVVEVEVVEDMVLAVVDMGAEDNSNCVQKYSGKFCTLLLRRIEKRHLLMN